MTSLPEDMIPLPVDLVGRENLALGDSNKLKVKLKRRRQREGHRKSGQPINKEQGSAVSVKPE